MEFSGLDVLFEAPDLPSWELPATLQSLYGGRFGFGEAATYANFVSTVDGVAAIPQIKDSPAIISGKSRADAFVMGLLRASSDAVLIGAGTMRDAVGHLWTPEYIYPELAGAFEAMRNTLGKTSAPALVVVTGRGDVPEDHPALERGALVLTTPETESELIKRLPGSCRVVPLGSSGRIPAADLSNFLSSEGFRHVLSEAGPGLFAQLLQAEVIDELFLTSSPLVAGRGETPRPGIVAGFEFLPDREVSSELISSRRSGSYLFSRYRLPRNYQ